MLRIEEPYGVVMQNQRYIKLTACILLNAMLLQLAQAQSSVEYGYSRTIRIASPAFKPMNDVEGTPYVPGDSVERGWLVLSTKRIPTKLHYNSYTGEVEYMDNNRVVAAPNTVLEFTILAPDTLHFKRGFPAVGSWSVSDFYQILFDGRKTKLVKHTASSIKTNTDAMANDYGKKNFQKREEYFVWVANEKPPLENYAEKLADGVLKPVVTNKKVLTSLFPQDAARIERYMADQKLKLKSWEEFAGVLKYLDTL